MRISASSLPQLAAHFSDGTKRVLCSGPPLKAAPGKFESKRFCFDNKVITPWHVTFMPISVVLSRKEPYHADSQTALSRWRSPYLRYLRETDERGAGLSPCPSRA